MRASGIFHPLFATHPRPGINTSMTDFIEISKPTGDYPTWTPGDGVAAGAYELVYQGPGRVQPNLDWRARDRKTGGELDATQAARVQIPFGANVLAGSEGIDPHIGKDYRVKVISSEAADSESLQAYTFTVRNAIQASQKWLRTFLADTGTRVVE